MKKTIIMLAVVLSLLVGAQSVFALTSSLDFGSRGANVTELQTYLAKDSNIYPSGLVT